MTFGDCELAKRTYFQYGDYRETQLDDVRVARPRPPRDEENLTGFVRGLPASDLEERMARSFNRFKIPFGFQVPIYTATSMPGDAKMVDFVVRGVQPVEPAGFVGHYRTAGQRANDRVREMFLNEVFRRIGWRPLISIKYTKLDDQEMTDRTVRELRL